MVEARPATTLILLRPGADGPEVFLVQRNRHSGFLPNAWVFPGGRVDDGDALGGHPGVRGGGAVAAQWGIDPAVAMAHLVAGVRETFEECGIWLGENPPPADERAPLAAGARRFAELLDAGASIDLDRLIPWAWWVTPAVERRRFDTRFLVAVVDGEAVGAHDERETVASGWFAPSRVVDEGTLGTFPLAPPTWWTLRELAAYRSIPEILAAAEGRTSRPIQPIMEFRPEGLILLLPGHPGHPEPAVPGLPTHVVYEDGRWVALDGSVRLPALP
jgi:8-oxo-dGTP pyrophosphatase MutT (NUDIX family)